jgi:predicted TIM-barrel fold metal-dependent hydrolase
MTLAQMDEHNIVLALLHDSPENIARLRSKDPGRFLAFPDLRKGQLQPTVDQFDTQFDAGEWSGIGEIRTVYNGLRPTDRELWPYYELANRHDVPVFWHSAGSFPGITRVQPEFRMEIGRPLNWEDVFVRYPDLRVVLVHAGYPFLDEMIAILHLYPAVFVDTGAISHFVPNSEFYRYYGTLIGAGFGDRILFGSDQMGWPEAIGYSVNLIKNAPWSDSVKRDILYNNAAKLLRLSDKRIEGHYGWRSN